jgi:hypothetical protein
MTNLSPKLVKRTGLYFGEYAYSLKFYMPDVHVMRYQSHDMIDQILESKENNNAYLWTGDWGGRREQAVGVREHLHEFLYFLNDILSNHKLTVQRHCGHLYTNDVNVIDTVSHLGYLRTDSINQVKLIPEGILVLRDPCHAYRTYFKNQRISIKDKERLIAFMLNQPSVRTSPGLQDFLTKWPNYCYLQQNYFIDHNDMGFITMLKLVCAASLKKTITLVKR